jgi:hypothetical protein
MFRFRYSRFGSPQFSRKPTSRLGLYRVAGYFDGQNLIALRALKNPRFKSRRAWRYPCQHRSGLALGTARTLDWRKSDRRHDAHLESGSDDFNVIWRSWNCQSATGLNDSKSLDMLPPGRAVPLWGGVEVSGTAGQHVRGGRTVADKEKSRQHPKKFMQHDSQKMCCCLSLRHAQVPIRPLHPDVRKVDVRKEAT